MRGAKVAVAVSALGVALALPTLTGFTTAQSGFTGTVYVGMDTPLTGPQQPVGQGDREAVEALVKYWNGRGGIKGKRLVVDVLDNASNPSQGVQNVRKFLDDRKYVAILGSGNAAAAVATAPLASQGKTPFLALSPPTNIFVPPLPYVYVTLPTSRLYAFSGAQYLKSLGIKRVALMGDNGGFGLDGMAQVEKLASAYGVTITDKIVFAPTTTSFAAELTKVKNSNAEALWLWTATPAGSTIVKEYKQLQLGQRLVLTGANLSPSFLESTCPDANGAIVNGYLGLVWPKLPKSNPIRAEAALMRKLLKHPVSVFNIDAATTMYTLRAAMERSGFTREAINTGLETKIKGLVSPGGRVYLTSTTHTGIRIPSMWAGRIEECKANPLFGAAFSKK